MGIKEPRVLQLIDSLAAGGAERVSVNLANALKEADVPSYLCATRQGGALESFLSDNVGYMILHKHSALDMKALGKLIKFIKKHKINVIHAHSSSFFTAVLCKPFTGVKIIWHDHNGIRYEVDPKQNRIIIQFSHFFDAVISVNEKLVQWSKNNLYLHEKKIIYVQNFAQLEEKNSFVSLPGTKNTRIVCLANLRWQKDHINLLKAFEQVHETHREYHLLLVGEDKNDAYSQKIKAFIKANHLQDNVHILGTRSDSADILLASGMGILSSESEGLPVALLEYGLAKLPVVCTEVGQCAEVLGHGVHGEVVPAKDSEALAESMLKLIEDEKYRESMASKLNAHVRENYSSKAVVQKLVEIYNEVLNA